jgi:hypothetical protein
MQRAGGIDFIKFTSEKATTCGGGLKVPKGVVAFSSHPAPLWGAPPHTTSFAGGMWIRTYEKIITKYIAY